MQDDYYDYDSDNQWIIGRRTRKKYQLGDPIKVIVVAADIFKRTIDLNISDEVVLRVGLRKNLKVDKPKSKVKSSRSSGKKRRRN
jgi:ribonuclease R